MAPRERLSILLLADDQKGHANTIHDHIQAFVRHSHHRIELFNPRGLSRSRHLRLDDFDVVVIHYSIAVIWDDYLSPWFRDAIAAFDGLKVQFIQDEYRLVDAITAEMRHLGIDMLYSVVPPSQQQAIYGERLPDTEIVSTLTGYVPRRLAGRQAPPLRERPLDVGYRGRSVPYWLGRLGFEKVEIGRQFAARAADTSLDCDIAWTEGARINGPRWNDFIASCRTMLASESGSSLVDFDGSIETSTRAYVAEHPAAGYEEVEGAVLSRFAGGPYINAASPRIFESAALKTALIMFPGEYSGIVTPWEHYIPLEKDFSNFDEVVGRITDLEFLDTLTGRAHRDLIASGRYSEESFIASFDRDVEERARPRGRLTRYPSARLAVEQLAAGRSYHVSTLYWLARDVWLGWLGVKEAARRPALRRLLLHRGARRLWDDIFRLAMLSGIRDGSLVPASEPFDIVPTFDPGVGRLTFTSREPGASEPASVDLAALAEAVERRELREILWNHAAVGQYVTMRVPPLPKRISFDVGRYDGYGVYRFDALRALALRRPTLVVDALRPLLAARSPSEEAYGSGREMKATRKNEAET